MPNTWKEPIDYTNSSLAVGVSKVSGYQITIPINAIPQPGPGRDLGEIVLSISGSQGAGLTDTTFGDLQRIKVMSGTDRVLIDAPKTTFRTWFRKYHRLNFDYGAASYDIVIPFTDFWKLSEPERCRGAAPRNGAISIVLTFDQTQNGTGQIILGHCEFNNYGLAHHTNFLSSKGLLAVAAAAAAPYDSQMQRKDYDEIGEILAIGWPFKGIKEIHGYQKDNQTPIFSYQNRLLTEYNAANAASRSIKSGSPMRGSMYSRDYPLADVDGPGDNVNTGIFIEKFESPIRMPQGSKIWLRTDSTFDAASEIFAMYQMEWAD